MPHDFKFDFSNLVKSPWMTELNRYVSKYEKQAKELISELDRKSRQARSNGVHNLEKLTAQILKVRQELEKKVTELAQKESIRVNEVLNELLEYVRSIAKSDKPMPSKRPVKRSAAGKARKSAARKPSGAPRKLTAIPAAPTREALEQPTPPPTA